jgi:hypothetical protein
MLGVHGHRRVCTCTRTYTLLRLLQKMWDLGILRLVDRYDRLKKIPMQLSMHPLMIFMSMVSWLFSNEHHSLA